MEKSLSFEECLEEAFGLTEKDPVEYSPLNLAFIGDCVYDLIIKNLVFRQGNRQVSKLQAETSHYVQASAQSQMMRVLQDVLTEEEHAIYRRSTGFEALIGYLYLKKDYERIMELVKKGLMALEFPEEV